MGTIQTYTPQQLVDDLKRKWSGDDTLLGPWVGVINSVLGSGRYKVRGTADLADSIVEVVSLTPNNYQLGNRVVMVPVLGGETYIIGPDNAGGVFDLKAFTIEGQDPVSSDPWSTAINRVMHWYANSGLTTFATVGMASPVLTGTVSAFDSSAGPHVRIDSTNVSGNVAGIVSSFVLTRTDWNTILLAKITTGTSIANIRYWIGLFSGDPRATGAPNLHMAAFRFDTSVDSAFWRCVTGDGANRTASYGLNKPIASSSEFELLVDLTATRARFYIDGDFIVEINGTLPASGQKLGIVAGVTTLEASAKMIRVNRISLAHK